MNKNKFNLLFEEMMSELADVEMSNLQKPTKTCELCNHPFESSEAVFQFDDFNGVEHDHICTACAEKVYDEHKDAIEADDAELKEKHSKYDLYKKCHSCEGLYPESELKDTDAGKYCEYCIDGLISRGEPVSINYN